MEETQDSPLALEKGAGLLRHRMQNLVQLQHRGDFHPDAVEGSCLSHAAAEFGLSPPQLCLPVLEGLGHAIEGLRELADLIPGRDGNALPELPGGDSSRGGHQAAQGKRDRPGEDGDAPDHARPSD
jgi:hypothetical protein